MSNLDDLKDKNFNVYSSLVTLAIRQNTLLSTLLDVMVGIRMKGETEEEKDKIMARLNEALKENRNEELGYLVPSKDDDPV